MSVDLHSQLFSFFPLFDQDYITLYIAHSLLWLEALKAFDQN